ncbi:myosin-1-like isoform X3 [Neocloeon triangulifer]|uniref:myosin-1-like isoform X3 n=1 Tax=Neocloeon triangulifer TaxID=2078957 RepID=UPI00286EF587|nr:myosin-1-like isoform X3 [Neocloeon triangulifer]
MTSRQLFVLHMASRRRLEAKVEDLSAQIAAKDAEIFQLKNSLGELTREVGTKAACMERVQAELDAACKEAELAKISLKKFVVEKENFRHQNDELKEELEKRTSSCSEEDDSDEDDDEDESSDEEDESKGDLKKKVKDLEEQLAAVTAERDQLLAAKETAQKEWEEELKSVKEALDDAVAQKQAVTAKYEKEYEQLRTVNSDREQQMLDDFEWKLREVQSSSKKKLEEKTKEAERRIKDIQIKLDQRIAMHTNDVEKLKKIEAEITQLKSMSHDQQRLIREAQREHDSLQANIGMLNSEISRLNAQLLKERNVLSAVQGLNHRKREEREELFKQQLEEQKKLITQEADERIQTEVHSRLQHQVTEALQRKQGEFDRELAAQQSKAQEKLEASQKQVLHLKEQMARREEQHRKDMSNAIQESDSSRLELRRKLDKLDLQYQDKAEALSEAHAIQIEELEKRASQAEMQLVSSKATLELVKQQMTKDFDEKFNELYKKHQQQLARQRDELQEVHEEEIAALQARHMAEIAALCKNKMNGDIEMVDSVAHQEVLNKLRKQELMISDLVATIREQDHALTTMTQEKRELQLQLRNNNQQQPENVIASRGSMSRVLRKISECTEPSRESSMDECEVRIEEVLDDEETEVANDFLMVLTEEELLKVSPSPSGCSSDPKTSFSEEDELQVPRTYFICHSPDQVFPAFKRLRPERCLSLELGCVSGTPFFGRANSCPARLTSDDGWGD